jgi:hypothetical protein
LKLAEYQVDAIVIIVIIVRQIVQLREVSLRACVIDTSTSREGSIMLELNARVQFGLPSPLVHKIFRSVWLSS